MQQRLRAVADDKSASFLDERTKTIDLLLEQIGDCSIELYERLGQDMGAWRLVVGKKHTEVFVDLLRQDNPPLRFQTARWAVEFVAPKMSGDLDGRNVNAANEAYLALGK